MPEFALEGMVGHLAEAAGQLHPGRSSSHHNECQAIPAAVRIGREFGGFKRQQNASPNLLGFRDRFQRRGRRLPFIVSKVVGGGAGRDDERVVTNFPGVSQQYLTVGQIEIGHFAEAHLGVLLAFQQVTQRGGNIGRGQAAGGDLVEQRLEQVEVSPVDQGHLDRNPFQGTRREEAAKAASDNDNAVLGIHRVPPRISNRIS
jgi:hypothetical protein